MPILWFPFPSSAQLGWPPSLGNNSHVARVDHSWATRAHFLELSRALFLVLSPWTMALGCFAGEIFEEPPGLTNSQKLHKSPQKGFISKKENVNVFLSHNHEGVPPPTTTTQNLLVDQNREVKLPGVHLKTG